MGVSLDVLGIGHVWCKRWVTALVCVLENDKVNNIFVRTIRVSSKKWGHGLINIFGFWCWPENLR